MSNKKPMHFFVFKILGVTGIILLILSLFLILTGFDDFESNRFMIGAMLLPFSVLITFTGIMTGFKPEIAKLKTKTAKYIQDQNKQDLADISDNAADIMSGAITKTVQAVKSGLDDTMFCKHCGAQIDADSAFCNKCGKKL